MQIFWFYKPHNAVLNARAYADTHVVKIPLEITQLCYTVQHLLRRAANSTVAQPPLPSSTASSSSSPPPPPSTSTSTSPTPSTATTSLATSTASSWQESIPGGKAYRPTHTKHPLVGWIASSLGSYLRAVEQGIALCHEYSYRFEGRVLKVQPHLHWLRDHPPPSLLLRAQQRASSGVLFHLSSSSSSSSSSASASASASASWSSDHFVPDQVVKSEREHTSTVNASRVQPNSNSGGVSAAGQSLFARLPSAKQEPAPDDLGVNSAPQLPLSSVDPAQAIGSNSIRIKQEGEHQRTQPAQPVEEEHEAEGQEREPPLAVPDPYRHTDYRTYYAVYNDYFRGILRYRHGRDPPEWLLEARERLRNDPSCLVTAAMREHFDALCAKQQRALKRREARKQQQQKKSTKEEAEDDREEEEEEEDAEAVDSEKRRLSRKQSRRSTAKASATAQEHRPPTPKKSHVGKKRTLSKGVSGRSGRSTAVQSGSRSRRITGIEPVEVDDVEPVNKRRRSTRLALK